MRNKTKKIQIINEKVMIATIDIGMTKNTGYWRYNNISIKPFEFANNADGFKRFWQKIWTAKIINRADNVIIGFEPTGSYEQPLIHYLINKPVKLVQINPTHTKRVKELNDNSPLKTDKKDPEVIADIIQLGHYLSLVVPKGSSAQLRNLVNSRESTIKNRTMSINRLHRSVYMIFPEFLEVMKTVSSKSSMYLLKHYSTPFDIINLGLESLACCLRKTSRGRFSIEHAERLYNAANNSVGIKEGVDSIVMGIQQIIKEISLFNDFINEIETKMNHYLKEIPESQYILSIKGIGEVTTAGIIGEVGDFNDFHNQRAIIKLAGLNLYEVSSGDQKGIRHISKRGRSLLRKILFFASLNVVRKNGIMHEYYHRLIDNGMIKKKALIAVSRKLLKLIFSLARKKRYYIHNYEMKSVA
ncbi:MAG: hypothetical protein A2328_11390 [Bdellovibrionales bacterium RIFOXYB2_FULL_36_6]|nr:MAG: hypothetical protein A2328_11390 [Bdellovibrionales bacterium RIFOXYB2_FULL_36_6]